jgi:hypothetical protein
MKLQFKITLKQGTKTVAEITGREDHDIAARLTLAEVVEKVQETEQFIEKLTGLRCHIEQIA